MRARPSSWPRVTADRSRSPWSSVAARSRSRRSRRGSTAIRPGGRPRSHSATTDRGARAPLLEFERVTFVLFSDEHLEVYREKLSSSVRPGSARHEQLHHRADALRVELHLLDGRLDRREVPRQHRVPEPPVRHLHLAVRAQDLGGVLGVAGVVLLAGSASPASGSPGRRRPARPRRRRPTTSPSFVFSFPFSYSAVSSPRYQRFPCESCAYQSYVFSSDLALLGHLVVDDARGDPGQHLRLVGDGHVDALRLARSRSRDRPSGSRGASASTGCRCSS